MEGYRTATLDLKNRKKGGSVPFADSEDETNPGYGGRDYVCRIVDELLCFFL